MKVRALKDQRLWHYQLIPPIREGRIYTVQEVFRGDNYVVFEGSPTFDTWKLGSNMFEYYDEFVERVKTASV